MITNKNLGDIGRYTDMIETWKPIEGYEGLYEVSDLGRVRSLVQRRRWKPHILKPGKTPGGYLTVNLCKNSKPKSFFVHRLVAQAFCPNPCPDKLTDVNHRDEVKTNNVARNLEWCDRKYNLNYGTHNDRMAKSNTNHPKKSKQVQKFDKQGNLLATFPSMAEVVRVTGINRGRLFKCCNGKLESAGGYFWRYL